MQSLPTITYVSYSRYRVLCFNCRTVQHYAKKLKPVERKYEQNMNIFFPYRGLVGTSDGDLLLAKE